MRKSTLPFIIFIVCIYQTLVGTVTLEPSANLSGDKILNPKLKVFTSFYGCLKVMDTSVGKTDDYFKCANKFLDPSLSESRKQQLSKLLLADVSMTSPEPCTDQQLSQKNQVRLNREDVLCFTLNDGTHSRPGYVFYFKQKDRFLISDIKTF